MGTLARNWLRTGNLLQLKETVRFGLLKRVFVKRLIQTFQLQIIICILVL